MIYYTKQKNQVETKSASNINVENIKINIKTKIDELMRLRGY